MQFSTADLAQAIKASNEGLGSYIIRFTAGNVKGQYYGTLFNAVKTRKSAVRTVCRTEDEWKAQLLHSPFFGLPFEIICVKEPVNKIDKAIFQIVDDHGLMFENTCPETVTQELENWFSDNAVYTVEESQEHINTLQSLDINTLVTRSFENDDFTIFTVCGFSLIRKEAVSL